MKHLALFVIGYMLFSASTTIDEASAMFGKYSVKVSEKFPIAFVQSEIRTNNEHCDADNKQRQ